MEAVLARTEPEKMQKIYGLPEFGSALEFLTMLALSTGKLLKGGTPDILAAARQVLTDWNHQKIPFFSVPPAVHPSQIPSMISSASGEPFLPSRRAIFERDSTVLSVSFQARDRSHLAPRPSARRRS